MEEVVARHDVPRRELRDEPRLAREARECADAEVEDREGPAKRAARMPYAKLRFVGRAGGVDENGEAEPATRAGECSVPEIRKVVEAQRVRLTDPADLGERLSELRRSGRRLDEV